MNSSSSVSSALNSTSVELSIHDDKHQIFSNRYTTSLHSTSTTTCWLQFPPASAPDTNGDSARISKRPNHHLLLPLPRRQPSPHHQQSPRHHPTHSIQANSPYLNFGSASTLSSFKYPPTSLSMPPTMILSAFSVPSPSSLIQHWQQQQSTHTGPHHHHRRPSYRQPVSPLPHWSPSPQASRPAHSPHSGHRNHCGLRAQHMHFPGTQPHLPTNAWRWDWLPAVTRPLQCRHYPH